jgi:hypothetical protein
MDHVNRDPTETPISVKFKRLKMLTIGLGTVLGICALAALGIGLYYLISNAMKTTSTTTAATPGKYYVDLPSRMMPRQIRGEMNEKTCASVS